MIAALVLYCLVVSALLAVVGYAFEQGARLLGWPTRFAWTGALVLTVVFAAAAPFRSVGDEVVGIVMKEAVTAPAAGEVGSAVESGRAGPWVAIGDALREAFRSAVALGSGGRGVAVMAVWAVLSALVAVGGLVAFGVSSRRRRRWPLALLSGERVRVAPDDGPAVVGLLSPEIVVPRWLIDAPEDRRRMAVEHEREHLRGGDPYLLALGWAVTALLPWNPAVWWMHLRLRDAVELDCDRRVLRRGVKPRAYGSFLIDAAEFGAGRLRGAVSLIRSRSTLKRRLGAMTTMKPRFAAPRAALVAVLGVVALAAACEPRLPTQAEVDEMDAAKAEQFMYQAGLAEVGEAAYYVDGERTTTEEARSYAAEQVARVEVVKGEAGPAVYIFTKDAPQLDASAGAVVSRISPRDGLVEVKEPTGGSGGGTVSAAEFDGLIIVDGEVRDDLDLSTIDKLTIQSIEIVKGEAATELYSQPEAANGVILITTRR